jgi:hypothetical protein
MDKSNICNCLEFGFMELNVNHREVIDQIILTCTRVGFIFVICGILVGVFFSAWIPIFIIGFTFLLPEIGLRLVEGHWSIKRPKSGFDNLQQLNKEEI